MHTVRHFYRNRLYLDALVKRIGEALDRFPRPAEAELVFSAHSVPQAASLAKEIPTSARSKIPWNCSSSGADGGTAAICVIRA